MATLLETVSAAHPAADIRSIERAYTVAARAHRGQRRKSGDPFITHPIAVATIVAEIGMRPEAICAALLHDTVVDDYSLARLTEDFGEVVAHLVGGVTKLDRVVRGHTAEAETIRKIIIAMAGDPRVLVIKLADRLHNMRTLQFLPPELQARKAKETLEVLAPLAHQLGIATIKQELEDLASGILYPRLPDERPYTSAERFLATFVVLLPAATRTRWLDEWTGELSVDSPRAGSIRPPDAPRNATSRNDAATAHHARHPSVDDHGSRQNSGRAWPQWDVPGGGNPLGARGMDGRCDGPRWLGLARCGALRSQ